MTEPTLDQGFGFHVYTADGDWTAIADVSAAQRQMRLAAGSADAKAQAAIQAAWEIGDRAIQERQDVFLAKIAAARANGTPITEAWLFQVARLDQLRAQVAAQYTALGVVTNTQVARAQRSAAGDAIDATQAFLEAQFYRSFDGMTDAEIRAWAAGGGGKGPPVRLDYAATDVYNAVTGIVGMVQTGAPLRDLTFSNLTVEGANSVANALVAGATRGASIQDIAAAMRLERNLTLARAQTIARTEILRANRLASLQTMRTATITTPNGTMKATKGWKWSCAPGGRNVCGVCLSLAGSVHPPTEDFQSHPNCRCSPVPITPTWEEMGFDGIDDAIPRVQEGADLIASLTPQQLRQAFGPTRADLITQGYLKPDDLVSMVNRGRWGDQPRLASVKDCLETARLRGYVPPAKAPSGGSGGLAGVKPDTTTTRSTIPGLDDIALGPNHPVAKRLDAARADLLAQAARQDALNERIRDAGYYTPEGIRLRAERDELAREMRATVQGHASLLKADREAALARLEAVKGDLPDDQARQLMKALDDGEAWRKAQRALLSGDTNPGLGFSVPTYWADLVDTAGYKASAMRRAAGWVLPVRERFAGLGPQPGGQVQAGSATRYGKTGKVLAEAQAAWEHMVGIADWQERTFGWRTQWNGIMEVGVRGSKGAAGVFHWDDAIGIHRDYQSGLSGTKVQTHELFHAMSGSGYRMTTADYMAAQGWEEGVVERCAQVWETTAFRAAGVPHPGTPAYRTYQKYTEPLERIRSGLGMTEQDYYRGLIATPPRQRAAKVLEWAKERGLTHEQTVALSREFSRLGV